MGHGQGAEHQIGPFIETYCLSALMDFLVLCKQKEKQKQAAVSTLLETETMIPLLPQQIL